MQENSYLRSCLPIVQLSRYSIPSPYMLYLVSLHIGIFVLGGPTWGLWPCKTFLAVGFGWFHHPEGHVGTERRKPACPWLYCSYHLQVLWCPSPAIPPLSSTCLSGSRLPGEPLTLIARVIVCCFYQDQETVCFSSQLFKHLSVYLVAPIRMQSLGWIFVEPVSVL